jgi:hypothetical protein
VAAAAQPESNVRDADDAQLDAALEDELKRLDER